MTGVYLETARLVIRPFEAGDLEVIHRILELSLGDGSRLDDPAALEERRSWLEWSRLSQEWLPRLEQPPYGDLAVVLKTSGELVGAVGYVPLLMPFDQIPALRPAGQDGSTGYFTPEVGLFWAVDPQHRRKGYAAEAARGLIERGFRHMKLKRILATTAQDNLASQGVMRKVGMRLWTNPQPDPPWMQVVGYIEAPQPG